MPENEEELLIRITDESHFPDLETLLSYAASHAHVVVELTYEAAYVPNANFDRAWEIKQVLAKQLRPMLPDRAVTHLCSIAVDGPRFNNPKFKKAGEFIVTRRG